MGRKLFKIGRTCMVLAGKYAGRKVLVLKLVNQKSKERNYYHALVVGIDKVPRSVNKNMNEKKIERKIRIKPFIKYININHLFPTRYIFDKDFPLKEFLDHFEKISQKKKATEGEEKSNEKKDPLSNQQVKEELLNRLKKMFEDKYKKLNLNSQVEEEQSLKFLYKKLRF